MSLEDLKQQAHVWLEKEPDEESRSHLQNFIDCNDAKALQQAFSQRLSFGTAGLRGLMGVGPNNMNRLVVRETTAGLANYLLKARLENGSKQRVVIAYDGRHGSKVFAQDAAGVLAAKDIHVLLYNTVAPTPLCAFAVRKLGTAAGIVITASHNPPAYNGYKVYRSGGTQINDPIDGQIAREIDKIASLSAGPDCIPIELARSMNRLEYIGEELFQSYIETISAAVPPFQSENRQLLDDDKEREGFHIAYTSLHGVGANIAEQLLRRRGFKNVWTVKEQREPDGNFPTVEFPNPEEPGVTDLVMALADQHDAPLAIANDPDADRLCICARDSSGSMRQMTGDQLGSLLGDILINRALEDVADRRTISVRSTIVSSRILARIAQHRGVEHMETLTGFKWLGPSALRAIESGKRFVFAYEEALGYMVTDKVLDKDGLSALLAITEFAFALYQQGKTLWDRLEEVHRQVGLSITIQRTIKLQPGASGDAIMKRLRAEQQRQVGKFTIALTDDLAQRAPKSKAGIEDIPQNDVLRYYIATKDSDRSSTKELMLSQPRIIVRPSGTEPKVKIYCEMLGTIGETESYKQASDRVTGELTAIVNTFHNWMSNGKVDQSTTTSSLLSWHPRRLFTVFPLRIFAAAKTVSPTPQMSIKKPILYVDLPHPGKLTWASRDPRCLYWQMMLLFADIDFDCVHVGGYDDPNSAMGQVPLLQNLNGSLVANKDLPVWLERVSTPDQVVEKSKAFAQVKGINSLLQGPLMAGVVSLVCVRNESITQY